MPEEQGNEEVPEKPEKKKRKTAAERRQEREGRRQAAREAADKVRSEFESKIAEKKEVIAVLHRKLDETSQEMAAIQAQYQEDLAKHLTEYHRNLDE